MYFLEKIFSLDFTSKQIMKNFPPLIWSFDYLVLHLHAWRNSTLLINQVRSFWYWCNCYAVLGFSSFYYWRNSYARLGFSSFYYWRNFYAVVVVGLLSSQLWSNRWVLPKKATESLRRSQRLSVQWGDVCVSHNGSSDGHSSIMWWIVCVPMSQSGQWACVWDFRVYPISVRQMGVVVSGSEPE